LSPETAAVKLYTNSILLLIGGYAIAFTIISVLINHIIEFFGLFGSEQGLIISVINVGSVAAIVSTLFIFRNAKKSTLLVMSGLLSVVAMAFTGLAPSFFIILIMCLLLGISLGWTDPYINSCISDVDPGNGAKNLGALQGWYGVGAFVTPFGIQLLLFRNTWQEVYLILTPLVLLTVVIFMFAARAANKRIPAPRVKAVEFSREELRSFFSNRRNLYTILAVLTYSFMLLSLFSWTVRYMSVQHGTEALGIIGVSVMWVSVTISRFAAPHLPVSPLKLHTYGMLIAGAALAVGVFSDNAILMLVMIGVSGLTSGHCLPTLLNETIASNGSGSQLPTSVLLLMTRIPGIVAPPVLGWIATFSMQGSMLIPIVTVIVSGLLGYAIIRMK